MGLNTLTLICGLPNAGKTTFSKQFSNVLHQDDIGLIKHIVDKIEHADGDVIIEGYFGRKNERDRVREAHDGYAKCIFLEISVEESIKRENRNRHPQILRNASRFFEPPTLDEGWDEIIIVRNGAETHLER